MGGADGKKNLKPLALICRPFPSPTSPVDPAISPTVLAVLAAVIDVVSKCMCAIFPSNTRTGVYTCIETEKEKRVAVVRLFFFSKVKGISFILKVHRYPEE